MRFLTSVFCAAATAAATQIDNLITFGDSYTDEGRLNYLFQNGKYPPPGKMLPPSNQTISGGYTWARFVANQTGATLYDYAINGAICTERISKRLITPTIYAPSVLELEMSAFKDDLPFKKLYPNRRPDNTVYTLWIGTNDIGISGFLDGVQLPGKTISEYVDCNWEVFDNIYKTGGRRFVLFNLAPLDILPMYAPLGGVANGQAGNGPYWTNKTDYNTVEMAQKMRQYSTSVNTMMETGGPFNLLLKKRWPQATLAIFDVHSLLLDLYSNPQLHYSSPANSTGYYNVCPTSMTNCVTSKKPRSSFMWQDELHPSERTNEIIAKHFIDIVKGVSKYGKYYK